MNLREVALPGPYFGVAYLRGDLRVYEWRVPGFMVCNKTYRSFIGPGEVQLRQIVGLSSHYPPIVVVVRYLTRNYNEQLFSDPAGLRPALD